MMLQRGGNSIMQARGEIFLDDLAQIFTDTAIYIVKKINRRQSVSWSLFGFCFSHCLSVTTGMICLISGYYFY